MTDTFPAYLGIRAFRTEGRMHQEKKGMVRSPPGFMPNPRVRPVMPITAVHG